MIDEDKLPVGQVLRALRVHIGMTQTQFGEMLGWSRVRITRLENGQFQPTLSTLNRIAARTGYKASKIIAKAEKLSA